MHLPLFEMFYFENFQNQRQPSLLKRAILKLCLAQLGQVLGSHLCDSNAQGNLSKYKFCLVKDSFLTFFDVIDRNFLPEMELKKEINP